MLNKKGLHVETVVVLILFLLVVIFIGIAQSNIFEGISSATDREACADSVVFKARSKLGLSSPVDLKCTTKVEEIKKPDLDEIKKTIAEEFALCAKQFHFGKVDFLSEADFQLGKDTYCFICSKITFSEKVNKEYPKIEIIDYLNNEKIINGRTVAHYITNNTEFKFSKEQVADIYTDKNLYVLFHAIKYDAWGKEIGVENLPLKSGILTPVILPIGGGILGLLIGGPAGAIIGLKGGFILGSVVSVGEIATQTGIKSDYVAGFSLISSEEILKQCTEFIA